jgi:hypothetical protein
MEETGEEWDKTANERKKGERRECNRDIKGIIDIIRRKSFSVEFQWVFTLVIQSQE